MQKLYEKYPRTSRGTVEELRTAKREDPGSTPDEDS